MIKSSQGIWRPEAGWLKSLSSEIDYDLLLVFGPIEQLKQDHLYQSLAQTHPQALVFGCSTAGQIANLELLENQTIITGLSFEKSRLQMVQASSDSQESVFAVGQSLAKELIQADLVHVLVLSDGLHINGSDLVAGFNTSLPDSVSLSGGMAGDDGQFSETVVCTAQGASDRKVIALGFYGSQLEVGCGSCGGWDSFGPERLITRSIGNELFEMDQRSALELYSEYLGDYAKDLPATGLLFPLEVRLPNEPALVRTILGVNREQGSLIFAGDVPEGALARLMKTNVDHLLDGAGQAAQFANHHLQAGAEFALLISCYGRKMVLKQRCEEELEEVLQGLNLTLPLAGFYSYGEIAPDGQFQRCNLHNQTMTVTLWRETTD